MTKEQRILKNTTLRLPDDLRDAVAKAAEAAGRTVAGELRAAIAAHYGMSEAPVSIGLLEERIRRHEQEHHCATATLQQAAHAEESEEPEQIQAESRLAVEKAETRKVLEALLEMLSSGVQPRPDDLAQATGISSRKAGRLLGCHNIKAKNTRIDNIPSRYYLLGMLPAVRAALASL